MTPTPDQPAVWREISSAPRTGEKILIWDGFSVSTGFWNGAWCIYDLVDRQIPWASHWSPLPPPPGEGDGGGDE